VGLRQRDDAHQAGGRCSVISYPPINPACDPEGDYDSASDNEEKPEK